MQQRLQENYALNQLVSAFEAQGQDVHTYFEDKELLQLTHFYKGEFEYEKALEVVQMGLDHFAFNSDFYIEKAKVLAIMEDYRAVLDTVSEGLALAPNDLELKLLKIYANARDGDIENSKSEIKNLLVDAKGSDKVGLLICKAYIHELEKEFEPMFIALKKALIIDPNEMKALEKIWIAVEVCKNYKESVLLHDYIIDRNPYNHQAWYNLGHAYACLGEYPESIIALEYSFLIEPTYEIGYKDCAEMCFQVGRFRQALSIYLEALDQFGIDMELLVSIGRCQLELDDAHGAKTYLSKAVAIDPYEDETHYYLGQSHFRLGEYQQAIASFAEAIKLEDRREEYYADLAKAYHLTNDYTLANYYFNKATETGPEEMQYWFQHIIFLCDIEAFQAAQDVLDESEQHTYGPEVSYIKAALAYYNRDSEVGAKLLEEAIKEDRLSLKAFYALYPTYANDAEIQALIHYFTNEI